MDAMSVSVGYTTGANVANANARARRTVATRGNKTAHTVCATLDGRKDATKRSDKVATERNVVSMPMRTAPSKVATIVLGSKVNAQLGK